jgi:hypothetical protein
MTETWFSQLFMQVEVSLAAFLVLLGPTRSHALTNESMRTNAESSAFTCVVVSGTREG